MAQTDHVIIRTAVEEHVMTTRAEAQQTEMNRLVDCNKDDRARVAAIEARLARAEIGKEASITTAKTTAVSLQTCRDRLTVVAGESEQKTAKLAVAARKAHVHLNPPSELLLLLTCFHHGPQLYLLVSHPIVPARRIHNCWFDREAECALIDRPRSNKDHR